MVKEVWLKAAQQVCRLTKVPPRHCEVCWWNERQYSHQRDVTQYGMKLIQRVETECKENCCISTGLEERRACEWAGRVQKERRISTGSWNKWLNLGMFYAGRVCCIAGWWVDLVMPRFVSGTSCLATVFTFWLVMSLLFAAFNTMVDESSVEHMITWWRSGIPSQRVVYRLCLATLTESTPYRFSQAL